MDAPGEVAQLGERLLGVLVCRADQQSDAAVIIGPARGRREVLLDLPEGQGERGEADLGSVVQVALDPAQPGRRLVNRAGAPLLQFAGALGRGGDPRLRVALGLGPFGAVLQRGVVARRYGRPCESPSTQAISAEPPSPTAAPSSGAPGCGAYAGAQRPMAAATASKQTARPVTEIRRGR